MQFSHIQNNIYMYLREDKEGGEGERGGEEGGERERESYQLNTMDLHELCPLWDVCVCVWDDKERILGVNDLHNICVYMIALFSVYYSYIISNVFSVSG